MKIERVKRNTEIVNKIVRSEILLP